LIGSNWICGFCLLYLFFVLVEKYAAQAPLQWVGATLLSVLKMWHDRHAGFGPVSRALKVCLAIWQFVARLLHLEGSHLQAFSHCFDATPHPLLCQIRTVAGFLSSLGVAVEGVGVRLHMWAVESRRSVVFV
jgi:hypothetical protein